jgi:DNA/RNA endonuclease YhcR with UshA esterase domain
MTIETYAQPSTKWLFTALAGVCLLILPLTRASARPGCNELSISDARALPIGAQVTLAGTVSTPSGAFASSFFDVGFGLQDREAGIYVSVQSDPHLVPGDRVRVSGVLADSYGLLVLIPNAATDVARLGHTHPPVAQLSATGSVGESTEGLLVAVKGKVTQAPTSDLPYGYKFTVDDGSGALQIFINVQTGIDLSQLSVGKKVKVAGFSSQFDDHYEIDPRSPEDLVLFR